MIIWAVVIVVGSIFGGGSTEGKNYTITHDGHTYHVEAYTKENQGQCVFISEIETRLCGDWSVEKLNNEEEY